MPNAHADRNLLFGILALQLDFISRDALVAAMNAWILDKAKPLGDILRAQGGLAEDELALLEGLVRKHLEKHRHDPRQSLASLAVAHPTLATLGQFADADLQASLASLGPATLSQFAESADGQVTGPDTATAPLPANARFRIMRLHARGGLGEVFVARD